MTKKEFLKYINDGIERGAKQKIAKALNIKLPAVTMWFKGKGQPSEYNIKKMSSIFSISEKELWDIFNDKNNNYFFENSGNIADNKSQITVNETSSNYKIAMLQKDMEIVKKEIEILKLKIEK